MPDSTLLDISDFNCSNAAILRCLPAGSLDYATENVAIAAALGKLYLRETMRYNRHSLMDNTQSGFGKFFAKKTVVSSEEDLATLAALRKIFPYDSLSQTAPDKKSLNQNFYARLITTMLETLPTLDKEGEIVEVIRRILAVQYQKMYAVVLALEFQIQLASADAVTKQCLISLQNLQLAGLIDPEPRPHISLKDLLTRWTQAVEYEFLADGATKKAKVVTDSTDELAHSGIELAVR